MATNAIGEQPAGRQSSLAVKAAEFGIEWTDSLDDASLDPILLADLPVEWARENTMLPVHLHGRPSLLVTDPADVNKQEYVAVLVGQELAPVLTTPELVLSCIERAYFQKDNSPADFIDDLDASEHAMDRRRVDDLLEVANTAPVTQLINLILLDAFKQRASDIHVEPFERRLRIRYRIDGVLYEQSSPPANMVQALVSRLKVMAHMDIAERRLPQDGMARVRVGEREVDIRVSTVPVAEGERVVLRLLDKDSTLLPLSALGMSGPTHDRFDTLMHDPNGIVVVCGPTGSGKTTTLYAALGSLDATKQNILTVEDPIEYKIDNIGQIQVKSKIGLTFSRGLRHILRQDPDVVLVGETRDTETAEIAMRAALTGHLVFTTLHTNDAASAIVRLMDMGVESYLIASCLRGILAQRLVRKLCMHCREPHLVMADDVSTCEPLAALVGKTVWNAVGCEKCTGGYCGRVGLFELLTVTPVLRDRIREGSSSLSEIREAASSTPFTSLIEDGLEKVLAGTTTIDEILSAASI